jgi:acetyl-CoA carboxylase biotin carboxylase subunit
MSEHGIKFIEPEMIDRMGDKASAKATIEAGARCSCSVGILESFEQAQELARSLVTSNA